MKLGVWGGIWEDTRGVGGGYEYHKIDCANSQRFNDNIKQLNVEALAIPANVCSCCSLGLFVLI